MPRVSIDRVSLDRLIAELDHHTLDDLRYVVSGAGRDIENVAPDGIKKVRIQRVVQEAHARGWLVMMLDVVIAESLRFGEDSVGVCKAVKAEWERNRAALATQAPDDPKSALVLVNGAPFVDREFTRPLIDRLIQGIPAPAPRVMVVRGRAAAGKSHLVMFITHLLEDDEKTEHVSVDLSRMAVDMIGPYDIMSSLVLGMNLDDKDLPSDQVAQEARIAEKLCQWFAGQSKKFTKNWLVVIDGLNRPNVGPGAMELIDWLAIAAAEGRLANTKLLLLALGTPVPVSIVNEVEDHDLPPLGVADLKKYIEDLATVMGREVEPSGVGHLTRFLLSGLNPPFGHAGMNGIRNRLKQLPRLISGDGKK